MERKTIYVCVFVGILGIAAAVAGFAAEATRVKVINHRATIYLINYNLPIVNKYLLINLFYLLQTCACESCRNLRLRWLTMALRSIASTQVVQPWGLLLGRRWLLCLLVQSSHQPAVDVVHVAGQSLT